MRILFLFLVVSCSMHGHARAQAATAAPALGARIGVYAMESQGDFAQPLPKQNRWPLQLGLGAAVGLAGGGLGGLVGAGLTRNDNDPWSELGGVIIGGVLGYTVGVTLGVKYAGDTDLVKGNGLITYGASIAGLFVGGGLVGLVSDDGGLGIVVFVASSVGTTMLGHFLSRKYVVQPSQRERAQLHILRPTVLIVPNEHGPQYMAGAEVLNLRF
ncbi:MAG: hypothetical protein RhofKO_19970 [Rhodothermales bacterium]